VGEGDGADGVEGGGRGRGGYRLREDVRPSSGSANRPPCPPRVTANGLSLVTYSFFQTQRSLSFSFLFFSL